MRSSWLGVGVAALTTLGCGGGAMPRATAPTAPGEQAKCQVAASQGSPLVTEWPASEKANLESRLREGGVVVAYSGCSMRMLPQCHVQGSYVWQRTTPATDMLEIESEDELYSKLPLGAASLEGELASSGRLAMKTTVSGQLKLVGLTPEQVPNFGDCEGATHVVAALSVGAFELNSGGALSARGGAGVAGIGEAGGGTRSSESLLRRAGSAEACTQASDAEPHPDCRSPIQMFLWTLPGAQPERGPPGTVKVSFVGVNSTEPWDVTRGEQFVCTTPCGGWFNPGDSLQMKTGEGKGNLFELNVPSLRPYAKKGPLEVQAEPGSMGMFAGGLTVTSLSGMAMFVGGILAGIGCATDSSGLCKAGLIMLPIGAVGLIPGIWMIVASSADAEVVPVDPNVSTLRGSRSWGVLPRLGGSF